LWSVDGNKYFMIGLLETVSKVAMTCLQITVYDSLDRNTLFQQGDLKNITLPRPTLKSLSSPWPSSIEPSSIEPH
jgi:hypothetical protein